MNKFLFLLISFLANGVLAAEQLPEAVLGTTKVVFMPVQTQGKLDGCSLVFNAIAFDHMYDNGNPFVFQGSILARINPKNMIFILKLGTTKVIDQTISPIYFGYLQTESASTISLNHKMADSDAEGFRLIMFPFEGDLLKVYRDMLETKSFTVGFNRREGGMDVMLPIDLTVQDMNKDTFERVHSNSMMEQFVSCMDKLTNSI